MYARKPSSTTTPVLGPALTCEYLLVI